MEDGVIRSRFQINNTDLGDTYQYADDYDGDGIEDPYDNCPWENNPDQYDDDGDGIGTTCDNCPNDANATQDDLNGDLIGDVCDTDIDGDGNADWEYRTFRLEEEFSTLSHGFFTVGVGEAP